METGPAACGEPGEVLCSCCKVISKITGFNFQNAKEAEEESLYLLLSREKAD